MRKVGNPNSTPTIPATTAAKRIASASGSSQTTVQTAAA